jgi:hypothetical protein
MSPMELVELRKQLGELIDMGSIRLSKASYGATILFQNKADESVRMCVVVTHFLGPHKIYIKIYSQRGLEK